MRCINHFITQHYIIKSDLWFGNHQLKIKRDISPDGTQHVDVGKTSVTKADTIDESYVDANSDADKNKDIWFSVCVLGGINWGKRVFGMSPLVLSLQ